MNHVALIMLASGLSRRFGEADKLMADYAGKPLAAHTAQLGADMERYAIVPETGGRETLYSASGWQTIINPAPELGQGQSLALAVKQVAKTRAQALIICLADMLFIRDHHLADLIEASRDVDAVMSDTGETLLPPALFKRAAFHELAKLDGDRGARTVFMTLDHTATVRMSVADARDVDTPSMLEDLQEAWS